MTDLQDQSKDPDRSADIAALRAELATVKAEADAQRDNFEHELMLARASPPAQRDTNTVTQGVVVQQETQALRSTLREKERLIEKLTEQCRGLEDQLEDHFQELDALRLQVEKRERELNEALRQPGPVSRSEPSLEADSASAIASVSMQIDSAEPPSPSQYDLPSSSGRAQTRPSKQIDPAHIPPPIPAPIQAPIPALIQAPKHGGRGLALLTGLALGLILAVGVSGGLWWSGQWPSARPPGSPLLSIWSDGSSDGRPDNETETETGTENGPPKPEPARPVPPLPVVEPETPPVRGPVRDANGPKMIALNPGSFRMGNPAPMTIGDARPIRDVSLDAFLIGEREVSFSEYDRFVRDTGARRPNDFGFGRGNQPVVDVTWQEAMDYTRWLSRRTGKSYRLPTEAEWEYVARAGTKTRYWWGNEPRVGDAVYLDYDNRQIPRSPAPVDSGRRNPFGLYNTAGNVYEWVADCYHGNYIDAPTDGSAVDEVGCRKRVARGGSFAAPAKSMRVYARRAFEPNTRIDMLGFRVARDAR